MQALKCDRCGKYFSVEEGENQPWRILFRDSLTFADLCLCCFAEFRHWWKNSPKETDNVCDTKYMSTQVSR